MKKSQNKTQATEKLPNSQKQNKTGNKETVEESEAQFWLLNNMMNAFVLFDSVFDADGNFISYRFRYINDAYERITGVKNEDVFGKTVHEVWPETEPSWIEKYGSVAMSGKPQIFDMYHKPTLKHYHCHVYRPWDTNKQFCVIFDDITERKKSEDLLRHKTAVLEAQLNSTIDGIIVVNAQGKKVLQNQRTVELWKIPPDIADNDDDNMQVQHVMHTVKNSEQFIEKINYLYKHPDEISRDEVELTDGTILDRYSAPVLGKDGQNYGRIWTFRDITERKYMEDEIREKSEEQSWLLKSMMNAFVLFDSVFDADGIFISYRFRYINDAYERITGVKNEDVFGKTVHEVWPETEPSWIKKYGSVAMSGKPQVFDMYHKPTAKHYHCYVYRPWDTNERFCVIFDDITERKQAEDDLLASEMRYRRLFECAKDGILILDASSGAIVDVNPFLSTLLGFSHDEFIGKHLWEIGLFKDVTASKKVLIELQTKNYVRYENLPLVTKYGRQVNVEFTSNVYEVGSTKVIQCNIRDISEQLQMENNLKQMQKMESIGRLAGGVAHDFNNMLSVIMGHTEMALLDMEQTHPLFDKLQEIQKAAQRSADLTRQLLAFARKQTVIPKVQDLNVTIEGMLKMLRRLIGENIDLSWIPGQNLWPVNIDPSQIDQILANLCINARDAILGTGKITIKTENTTFKEQDCISHEGISPGKYIQLSLNDNGCGMDKETLASIFEPFFTTKKMGKGTGLGLATVYGIIKQNKGFINVDSEPGKGTTFRIYLRRHVGKIEQIKKESAESASVTPGKETILLVEDEAMILDMATRMLENFGYRVLAADTPGKAINLATEYAGEIHLLMTDVIMPEMNGRDLAKKIMSMYPEMKRLFLSGYTAHVIAHHGMLDDGIHFLQKPFFRKELAESVRKALDS